MLARDLKHFGKTVRLKFFHFGRELSIVKRSVSVVVIHRKVHFRDLHVKSEFMDIDDQIFKHFGVKRSDVVMRLNADAVDLAAHFKQILKEDKKFL